jgi:phosphoserine phosphatase
MAHHPSSSSSSSTSTSTPKLPPPPTTTDTDTATSMPSSSTTSSSCSAAAAGSSSSLSSSPSSSSSLRTAAFFDYDKTLLSTDSAGVEATQLWDDSLGNGRYWLYVKFCLFAYLFVPLYLVGIVDGPTVNRMYVRMIYTGMVMEELQQGARILYQNKLKILLYPEMIRKMNDHKARGHLVFVVSASPEHLVRPFVDDHPSLVDGLFATRIETETTKTKTVTGAAAMPAKETAGSFSSSTSSSLSPHVSSGNGHPSSGGSHNSENNTSPKWTTCTGRPVGNICIGAEKGRIQRQLAERYGLDLSRCYSYSDHHHDVEFLEGVGHPVAVNPTKPLEVIAKKKDWPILRPVLFIEDDPNNEKASGDEATMK